LKEADSLAFVHDQSNQGLAVVPRMLGENDIAFGRNQVDQMLLDRRAMARHVKCSDELYQWAVRQFAGEAALNRIYWSSDEPEGYWSLHTPPSDRLRGEVRIASRRSQNGHSRECTFEELWSCAVFELNNCSACREFNELDRQMQQCEISRDQYIRENFRLEFAATQLTRKSFLEAVAPIMARERVGFNPQLWFFVETHLCDWRRGFTFYKDKDSYPWSYYGGIYDRRCLSK
jgi:hypothetical protein